MGKFDSFEILTTDYKSVNGTGIALDVLIPKTLQPGSHPVIVKFHGGGWVTGSKDYEPWFSLWLLELAIAKNAIIISPNYRFIPESKGIDILADLDDLWEWMHDGGLKRTLERSKITGLDADLGRIMTSGDSAGGYLSVQFAIDHSTSIRACSAEFPSLDFKEENPLPAPPTPSPFPLTYISDHLSRVPPNWICTSDNKLERFPLILSMMQQGTFLDYFGKEERLFPFKRIERGEKVPSLWIVHGSEDELVSVEGSRAFVDLVRERKASEKAHLEIRPGGHGLTCDMEMKNPWLKEGLELVTSAWLG